MINKADCEQYYYHPTGVAIFSQILTDQKECGENVKIIIPTKELARFLNEFVSMHITARIFKKKKKKSP